MEDTSSDYQRKCWLTETSRPTRSTMNQWYSYNKGQYEMAQNQGMKAEKVLEESSQMRDGVMELIAKNKKETEMRLMERIADIEFSKSELENARKNVQVELEAMTLFRERIQDLIKCVGKNALSIVEKCIVFREGRQGIDLSHDDVEKQLLREKKKIEGADELLDRSLEQTLEIMRELRAILYLLNRDLQDKIKVLSIESDCLHLKETNLDISTYHGHSPLDVANISIKEWEKFTDSSINTSKKKINNARMFRTHIDNLMKEIVQDLIAQYNITNEAFGRRIQEVKEAKTELQKQHYEIAKQVNDMTRNITELETAINEKEGFLALAQTRLSRRAHRPGVELVRDEVETRLVNEVIEIKEMVSHLQHMYSEAQSTLKRLLKTQVQLEEDINVKTNSLKIDEVDCMTIRQGIDYHSF